MKICYLTDRGRHRPINEDSLYVDEDLGLFVLADGMGGHNAGEVASRIAVEVVATSVREGLRAGEEAQKAILDAIADGNQAILEEAETNPAWEEMGSTVLVALIVDHHVAVGHLGDSRAYLIGDGEITQITHDHTFIWEWVREGRITKKQAREHPHRHVLTDVLGIDTVVDVDITVWDWKPNMTLLLCSDGLTDMLDDPEILQIVQSSHDSRKVCSELISAANERGGDDNISVVLVRNE